MARIIIDNFGGEIPAVPSEQLPQNMAERNVNTDSRTPNLAPLVLPQTIEQTSSDIVESIYLLRNGPKQGFLQFTNDVDVQQSPIANDPHKRVYWTGDGAPKMGKASELLNGTGPYPDAGSIYTLGLPRPTTELTASKTGATGTDGTDWAFAYSFVSSYGEESKLSPASVILTLEAGNTVNLSGFIDRPNSTYNVARRNIYANNGTAWYRIADLTTGPTSTSIAFPFDLILEAENLDNDPPPSDLKGLITLAGGIMAGFRDNEVCFSLPYLPHIWPDGFRLSVDWPIVAIAPILSGVAVMTTGKPYTILGSNPEAMQLLPVDVNQSCISKRSVVDIGAGAIYASPDGLVMISGQGAQLMTENIIRQDQWQAMQPETLRAVWHERQYIGFTDTTGFVFSPANGDFRSLNFNAIAMHRDLLTDSLYMIREGA